MTLRCSLRRLALSSALVLVAACRAPARHEDLAGATPSTSASADTGATPTDEAYRHGRCGPGIRSCSAEQSGQPCNPNNLNVLCTPQSNGSFCCLAAAQQ